jgi:anaerobic selenocysteine-containing dehydrogenase
VLVNRRTSGQYNSLSAEVTSDHSHHRPPTLLMSSADAARHRLDEGDRVVVTSDHGSCPAVVEVSATLRDGVVSLPHAWPDADVNRLTSDHDVDPLSAMPILSGFRVSVAADLTA